jgi:tetratricopeptide (TPR) repeat protein
MPGRLQFAFSCSSWNLSWHPGVVTNACRLPEMFRTTAIVLLAVTAAPAPKPDARELYNHGLEKLQTKDLREAERSFLDAARTNQDAVQPLAVYNLGHVRFLQGKETLSGEGNRQLILESGEAATALAEEVLRKGSSALLGDSDVRTLVERYNEARSARRQMRMPREETTRALDLLGSALKRWRASVNNFRSAHELDPANEDAKFNGDVVERHIAEQLRFEKKLQEQQAGITQRRKELRELMKKLWEQIPPEFRQEPQEGDEDDGDDEEDEEGENGQREKEDSEGGEKEEEERRKQKSAGRQKQRLGSDREIDPDMLRMLKEKIVPRTMSPGNEPGEAREFREGMRPGEPRKRKLRDW